MDRIRIGIAGYGNLGRGVECAIRQNPDMELAGIFTRRDPAGLKLRTGGAGAYPISALEDMTEDIDVLILCGGSATDLPVLSPKYARRFNLVDSFDTHPKIPGHFADVDAAAREGGKVSIISVGWDPGLFSLVRALGTCVLPGGNNYTFWGKGVSQGHSDAVRRIPGVVDARQYTIPVPAALEAVRAGANPELTTRQKHTRECFVVAEEGADTGRIAREIAAMPDYFADYDTIVHFITAQEMARDHSGLPHGGFVLRSGHTGWDGGDGAVMEFSLKLDSNPGFTSSVLAAYARAAYRLSRRGERGCRTVFDVSISDLSPMSPDALRSTLL